MRRKKIRWVPKIATPEMTFTHPDGEEMGIAYIMKTVRGTYHLLAYGGKRTSPDVNNVYRTEELARKRMSDYFDGLSIWKKNKTDARKAEKDMLAKGHPLKPGAIIYNSWGYDQTNIDFYEVISTTKNGVRVLPIAGNIVEATGPMSGNTVPRPGTWDRNKTPKYHRVKLLSHCTGDSLYICGFRCGGGFVYKEGMKLHSSWCH